MIATIGVELEGGWICTCPIRDTSSKLETDPITGEIWVKENPDGRSDCPTGGKKHGLKLAPEILKIIAAKEILPCKCIPNGIRGDGSVNTGVEKNGELSPETPLTPDDYEKWILDHYPQVVNMTCGFHVHFKFSGDHEDTLRRLAVPETESEIISGLARWGQAMKIPLNHPFWTRLLGANQFCQRGMTDDVIDRQLVSTTHYHDARYFAVHFPLARLGTMEIRVLPMFKEAKTAVKAVGALIRIVNKQIELVKAKPFPTIVKEFAGVIDRTQESIPNRFTRHIDTEGEYRFVNDIQISPRTTGRRYTLTNNRRVNVSYI